MASPSLLPELHRLPAVRTDRALPQTAALSIGSAEGLRPGGAGAQADGGGGAGPGVAAWRGVGAGGSPLLLLVDGVELRGGRQVGGSAGFPLKTRRPVDPGLRLGSRGEAGSQHFTGWD